MNCLSHIFTNSKHWKCSVHERNKQFECTICDSSFAEKNKLKTHISSVKEGKKSFKCNICDSYLTRNESLKAHKVLVHEQKKPFQCNTFGASFAKKQLESA